ncbi:2-isopropylmalate synthase [Desulfacinum hydrothermale DSM 13146]|uniref:2-isopropylmalate synthase n=1 Tax=Desulfacinum hydrothermale DSM 13146 TaxID=1121390 RepID=A0A1W1XJH0_9BACT|nr:2-isopropylmalate synthase [Desulfacinum hydrothermale]SMC24119.1 2-isopropylmalate synthase [Desulfacinum hydrothermale DSM 13146]
MRPIRIFDTTLRDGEKSPGTVLSVQEKVRLARQLARLGVDVLEAGFPAASAEQFQAVEAIARQVQGPVIAALARPTHAKDFEMAAEALEAAAKPRIHTFVPVSPSYRRHFLKMDVKECLALTERGVRSALQKVPEVEFSLVDALRAPLEDAVAMARVAAEAGAQVVNIADTVGYAAPAEVERLMEAVAAGLASFPDVVLSIHCHNDLGLAVANSLAAIGAGAGQVHCTVNGIGERAGNAALEELAAMLKARQDHFQCETGIRFQRLGPTCRLVKRLTGIGIQPHKPIVGANAFVYETTVPQLADAAEQPPYQIVDPRELGMADQANELPRDMTREGLADAADRLGYRLEDDELDRCWQAFLDLRDRKEKLFESDLESLLDEQMKAPEARYRLLYLNVSAGSISVPNATVQMEVDGEVIQDAGFGQGPVDAAFKTICKITRRFPKLVRYEVNAVTSGTDALGEVCVRLEEDGQWALGRSVATDVVLASAQALIHALNKLEQSREATPISEFALLEDWEPRL